jgi:hypothetical protein
MNVDEVLQEEWDSRFVEVYIDDILVHTPDCNTNWYWIGRVLRKLEENQLYFWKEKCQFKKEQVEFLGMELTGEGVKVSMNKVKAIHNEKPPKTKKGIRHFLGLMNYHQRFIKDYLQKARPLHDLTKDVPYEWSEACQQAFDELKEALATSLVLALPKDQGKFWLETDTSDMATGAILSQEQTNGSYRPLGYASKSFSEVEQRYTTYNKELLGIMCGLKEWRNLLISMAELFEILTDHHNLTYVKEPQKLTRRQVNWTTKLQDYDFIIKHVSSVSNGQADVLSRPGNVKKVSAKVGVVLPVMNSVLQRDLFLFLSFVLRWSRMLDSMYY